MKFSRNHFSRKYEVNKHLTAADLFLQMDYIHKCKSILRSMHSVGSNEANQINGREREREKIGSIYIYIFCFRSEVLSARVVHCGWLSESSAKIETKHISHGLLCSTLCLASRFCCAKFRSGVLGIPVNVSRCARESLITVCVCVRIR